MQVLLNLPLIRILMPILSFSNAIFPEPFLSVFSDLADFLHCLYSFHNCVPVVPYWSVSSLFKVKCGVNSHLLTLSVTIGLRPAHFPRVSLHLEVLKALRTTKLKNFAVVSCEHHAVPWVNVAGTEVALLYPHITMEKLDDQ